MLGVLLIGDAIIRAQQQGLDLVEVSPKAEPPVCRIMDYGKFKYEKSKKLKEQRKKQHVMHLKEIKFHPKTEEHDFNFKTEHARGFLIKGDRVKATMVFRGREIEHLEFGRRVLERFEATIIDLSQIELSCKMEGRNMISTYVPDRLKVKEYLRKTGQTQKHEDEEHSESTSEKVSEVDEDAKES